MTCAAQSRADKQENKMHSSTKPQFRTNCMRMIGDIDPNYEITFNFGTKIDPITAACRIEEWCKRIERKAFGKRWYKKTDDRLLLVGFPEHLETNPHWHGVARLRLSLRRALKRNGEK